MKRKASAIWNGSGKQGNGSLSTETGALKDTSYSFSGRFENGTGTNPEELIASAHVGCFTMALAVILGESGFTPERLESSETLTMDKVDGNMTITAIHVDVRGKVPGADQAKFDEIAGIAKANCPISRALNPSIAMTVTATLEA